MKKLGGSVSGKPLNDQLFFMGEVVTKPLTSLTSRGLGRYFYFLLLLSPSWHQISLACRPRHACFFPWPLQAKRASRAACFTSPRSPSLLRECLVMFFEDVRTAASRVVNIVDPPSVEQIVFYVCTYRKCIRDENHAVRLSTVPNRAWMFQAR